MNEYIEVLRKRVADLRAGEWDGDADDWNEAIIAITTLRARIAELEAWKADSLLRWQQAVTLGGQQLERIAELEREKRKLEIDAKRWREHEYERRHGACRNCGYEKLILEPKEEPYAHSHEAFTTKATLRVLRCPNCFRQEPVRRVLS